MSDDLPDVTEEISFDYQTKTYRASFDCENTDPSTAVIRMMATVKNKRPLDLSQLGREIDLDSLEQILTSPSIGDSGNSRKIEFTYEEYTVTVMSCGIIRVKPPESAMPSLEDEG